MERNKVMSFGEPSPDPVETADGFMVGGPLWPPPMENRVKAKSWDLGAYTGLWGTI